jgi:hypothetical protein
MMPWGPLDWLLAKTTRSPGRKLLLSCVGPEDRCLEVPLKLVPTVIPECSAFAVRDPDSRFTARIGDKTESHRRTLVENGAIADAALPTVDLFALDDDIEALLINSIGGNSGVELWLDVTSMPKRFFFLLTKLALRSSQVSTLYVTYAQPAPGRYTFEHLAEDPEIPQPLPGFGPSVAEPEKLVVGIGFESLGLAQLLGEYRDRRREVIYLLPFPPGQPYSRRVWDTVHNIGFPGEHRLRRVPALDVFGTVRQLVADTTDAGGQLIAAALAPYGPKPVSLGMCLYAIYSNAPCFYTQPRMYHPDYTTGRGPAWAYRLRSNGIDTVRLPFAG